MSKPTIFNATQFTATKWCSPQDKADFANWLVDFISKGFRFSMFHQKRYSRLSNCFQHIAHYNKFGFYDAQFETPEKRVAFLRHIVSASIYGDPAWTYSDVEREVQKWLRQRQPQFETWATSHPAGLPAYH